jgi:mRNA interferase MazF
MSYVPERGDVVWLVFSAQAGLEQAGRRPAVVLSPRPYNGKVGLLLACPLITQQKGYPFEVAIPAGLPVSGVVLADQIESLDWRARKAEYICSLPAGTVSEMVAKALVLVSPNEGQASSASRARSAQ